MSSAPWLAGKSPIKSSMIFPTNKTSIRFVVVYFRSPAMFGYGIHWIWLQGFWCCKLNRHYLVCLLGAKFNSNSWLFGGEQLLIQQSLWVPGWHSWGKSWIMINYGPRVRNLYCRQIWYCILVGGFKHFLFSIIYGMSSFPLTNSYFLEGFKTATSIF